MFYTTRGDLAVIPNVHAVRAGRAKIFTLAMIPVDHATNPLIGETLRPGEAGYLAVEGIQYLYCLVARLLLTLPESDPLDPRGSALGSLPGQMSLQEVADRLTPSLESVRRQILDAQKGETLLPEERLASLSLQGSLENGKLYVSIRNAAGKTASMYLEEISTPENGA